MASTAESPVSSATDARVAAIRRFNRFYTRQIGVLQEGWLHTPFSLTEVRVLYELAHRDGPTATDLARELGLDSGYLSRILRGFQKKRLIEKRPSESDGRQSLLRLTKAGARSFATFDSRTDEEVRAILARLRPADQRRLTEAMRTIEEVLAGTPERHGAYLLRSHQPGDMGWVVHRHGVLYAQEYGWDERFEALVAEIVAKFIRDFDPKLERCWIAEKDGGSVGSVFVVKKTRTIAQLRLLLVEPSARGLGIGARLVDECIRFARQARYRKLTLWTNDVLHSARRIYEGAGFHLAKEERHHSFGQDLTAQTWDLVL